jgi:hypothetical protein
MKVERAVLEGLADLRAARELLATAGSHRAKVRDLLARANQHFSSAARQLGYEPGDNAKDARSGAIACRVDEQR